MSDNERGVYDRDAVMDEPEHEQAGYDDEEEQQQEKKSKKSTSRGDFNEEEEEEEDVGEEDEEDEEDEEMVSGRKPKRTKHRHRRSAVSRFLDVEAEVSDDEEEEDEGELEGGETFVDDEFDEGDRSTHHALLDKKRLEQEEDKSPEQIARDLSRRYAHQRAVRYTGDMNEIPQRLLMPSVHDASLWQVRVKPGREREIVFSLMRKAMGLEFTAQPLAIHSALQRDSLPGIIYVEARSSAQVNKACQGLVGVYPSRGIQLVPIEEMASLLQIKKQEQTITPGSWVRIRRGRYIGDLGQVVDIAENGEDVGLRFIPRIDLRPRDDGFDGSKKRKKNALAPGNIRPPQRLFNPDEVAKIYGRSTVVFKSGTYIFQNETYRDGFIEKDFKLSGLILDDVNPTLEEITQFSKQSEGGQADGIVDLSVIAEASRKAAIQVLQPGDHVEVFEGEQSGVHGVVDEINQDVVTITALGVDIEGQKIELPARSVRKRFKPGDHVKVMTGQNADETGLVVAVSDNVVTFLSDMSLQEVSVFSKDLREAAEVGSSTNVVGNYELHDLVQLDAQTVGVIYKTERDSFRVLDQNGQTRLVQPHQISMRRDSNRAIATDAEGHEIRLNDNMKETEGEGRKGRVLHIHQSFFAFLHNREITENGGVFVTRTRSLVSIAPKGNIFKPGTDLSKMNPGVALPIGGMVGSGSMGRGPRDRHIGLTVVVVKGAQKGYVGTIKDTNGNVARVELRTGNKIISLDKDKLCKRTPEGKLVPLDYSTPHMGMGGPRMPNAGGRTPSIMGRTPNPYQDSRTPAWNASSRTPNPYAMDGGKTPAWNASSRTPNPYADGGRTPAWNANSRTPNPYASGGGGGGGAAAAASAGWATPRPSGWGDSTPGRSGGWGASPEGWTSPQRTPAWPTETWSAPTPGVANAATPAFAPTPISAPTPAAIAPTPFSAITPGPAYSSGSGLGAQTPGATWGFTETGPEQEFTLSQDWVNDSELALVQSRLQVIVRGTRVQDYLNGQYEDRVGRVKGVARVGPNNADQQYESYVTVEFITTGTGQKEERVIPVRFLEPVPPLARNDEAVILETDPKGEKGYKGLVVVVLETPDSDTVTVAGKDKLSGMFEVSKEKLAALAM